MSIEVKSVLIKKDDVPVHYVVLNYALLHMEDGTLQFVADTNKAPESTKEAFKELGSEIGNDEMYVNAMNLVQELNKNNQALANEYLGQ